MMLRLTFRVLLAAGVCVSCASMAWADELGADSGSAPPSTAVASTTVSPAQPIAHTTARLPVFEGPQRPALPTPAAPQPGEHPLAALIRWGQSEMPAIESLKDYSASLVKRERVNGELREPEYLALKIRHAPLSIYVRYLAPTSRRGQEAIYVEGQNDGKVWAHHVATLGLLNLDPSGALMMRGQRYPITELGILNMVRRMVEVAQKDMQHDECEVKMLPGAKINQRPCMLVQVEHPKPRRHFKYCLARIFVDDELHMPVRFESYGWPEKPGEQPELLEQYTYLDLRFNNGFTDLDFSVSNPQYHFPAARR